MLFTDNYSVKIEGAKMGDILPGDVVRGIIDERPISGRPVFVTSVSVGSAKPRRMARRIAVIDVHFTYPNGSNGRRVLPADRVVAIER